jgi:hypothetical protein
LEAAKGASTVEPMGDAEKEGAVDAEMTPARRRTMAELAKKRGFRISKEEVERFRELMKAYLGTQCVFFFLLFPFFSWFSAE